MRHESSSHLPIDIRRPRSEIMRTCIYIYAIHDQRVNEITTRSKITEENVKHMVEKITSHGMVFSNETNMGFYNFLENKETTPEQSHDFMSLRAIGQ